MNFMYTPTEDNTWQLHEPSIHFTGLAPEHQMPVKLGKKLGLESDAKAGEGGISRGQCIYIYVHIYSSLLLSFGIELFNSWVKIKI